MYTILYKTTQRTIGPPVHRVMQAAPWLVKISALYQEQGITLDESWITSIEPGTVSGDLEKRNLNASNDQTNPEDDWSEDETEISAGVTDRILTAPDFVNDNERQSIYNSAPAKV